jgi:DNA helicase-2/ATP-dependent DNA helicase PcrA
MTSNRKPNAETGPDLPHDDEPPFDLPQAPASQTPPFPGAQHDAPSISARAVAAAYGTPVYLEGLNP